MIGNNAAVHRMLKEEQIDITATTYTATDCSASDIYGSFQDNMLKLTYITLSFTKTLLKVTAKI
jgi:hypothetical protein